MRQPIVILVLTVAPALAAAQASAGAQAEARSKTEVTVQRGELPRIPEGFSAETRARLEAIFETARQKSLPAEPMTNRMAEGQAKGASESELVAASAITLAQLEMSQSALVRAGRGQPTEAEISRGAQLLARGASSAQLTLLAGRDPSDRRLDAALAVLTDLSARGMPVDRAITAVVSVGATAGLGLGSAPKP
jgi:hypothetical protein